MSRLLAILSLSIFLVGCEALWEEDSEFDLSASGAAPAAATAPAYEAAPAPVSVSTAEPEKVSSSEEMPVADNEPAPKFSWETQVAAPVAVISPVVEAPKDPAKARITEIRESLGLVAFVRSEAPAIKARLQLIKEGKVLVVEVASVKGTQVVANILPGQKNAAQLSESDIVDISSFGAAGNK